MRTAPRGVLGEAIGFWAPVVFVGLGYVAIIFLIVLSALFSAYIKKLLENEDHYLAEKLRRDKDPKAFSPLDKTGIALISEKKPTK
jgi:hypothetical protein